MATGAQPANVLTNGSFETGDLSGWFNTGNSDHTYVEPNNYGYGAEDGNYYVYFGAVGGDYGLNQTFADTAGRTYDVSYWVAGNGSGYSDVHASIDGVLQQTIGSPVPNQPYTEYTFSFTGTGSDTITLGLRNDPSYDALDNVVVAASVPEPAAWATMLLGVGAIGFAMRRRTRAIAA